MGKAAASREKGQNDPVFDLPIKRSSGCSSCSIRGTVSEGGPNSAEMFLFEVSHVDWIERAIVMVYHGSNRC